MFNTTIIGMCTDMILQIDLFSTFALNIKHYNMKLRIKEVIKERGMTITELADKMRINRVNLSNMINGNPTVETLNKIADAIGCPVTELFEQPKKDALTINCPHCGKSINIKVDK